jgi:hypothetical protein
MRTKIAHGIDVTNVFVQIAIRRMNGLQISHITGTPPLEIEILF